MATLYYESDGDFATLKGKKIVVVGYGSQGHAHALNLRDSGADVTVAVRPGSEGWKRAESHGWTPQAPVDAVKDADIVAIMVPDQVQGELWNGSLKDAVKPGATILFTHGFSVHFGIIEAPAGSNVIMCAPKGPGHLVRRVYTEGGGVPALIAIEKDDAGSARDIAMAWAIGIGSARAGVIETTFREETESDLFGEQAVLCGGVSELIKAGFETLTEAGYAPEIAYFECLHELKLIVDLIYEGGLGYMRYSVSDTAEYGDYVSGPRIINAATKVEMKRILSEIQEGTFAKNWLAENREGGRKKFLAMREANADHPIEHIGAELRAMMPFLKKKKEAGIPQA